MSGQNFSQMQQPQPGGALQQAIMQANRGVGTLGPSNMVKPTVSMGQLPVQQPTMVPGSPMNQQGIGSPPVPAPGQQMHPQMGLGQGMRFNPMMR